jgi:hypothetical protein
VEAITARLRKRIALDFSARGSADEVARMVSESSDSERVQAAIVLWASGDLERLRDVIGVTKEDWRDTLVRAGLTDEDWPERLDAALGTDS